MQLDDPVEAKCGDYLQCEDVPAMMAAYACFHRETLALGKGGEFWVYDLISQYSVVRAPLRLIAAALFGGRFASVCHSILPVAVCNPKRLALC
jgi:hypothetical protein